MSSPVESSPTCGEEPKHVQVDLANMEGFIGRIKAAPVCVDETLKKESTPTAELKKFCFPLETPTRNMCAHHVDHHEPSVVSSSSSTASRESALSDLDGGNGGKILSTPHRLGRKQSEQINLKVTTQKKSRNGRQTQRWFSDPTNQRVYRMVTGCVPIVEGGRVLFVSASRKPEWILPKGGWETDEAMEESAIRECFEEAGVLGILGPRLSEIDYETRKAKKRRLDLEELQKKSKLLRSSESIPTPSKEIEVVLPQESTSDAARLARQDLSRIQGQTKQSDETCSVASDSSNSHTHVRMTLFPLYVSEVKSSWPESGRFRKAVDIDTAIQMCASRPEFQAALKEVKERNLHQLPTEERFPKRVSNR